MTERMHFRNSSNYSIFLRFQKYLQLFCLYRDDERLPFEIVMKLKLRVVLNVKQLLYPNKEANTAFIHMYTTTLHRRTMDTLK